MCRDRTCFFAGRKREEPSRGLSVPESSTIPGQSQVIQSVISDSMMESLGRVGGQASTLPHCQLTFKWTFEGHNYFLKSRVNVDSPVWVF